MDRLTQESILRALTALSNELGVTNQTYDLFVVGGAALVLLYGARDSTKDVNAFAAMPSANHAIRKAALHVAEAQDLPTDWLNDAAKGYVHGLVPGALVFDSPYLKVRTLAPNQLLAMKLSPWRDDVDIDDARLLLKHLLGAKSEVSAQVEPHFVPGRGMKAQYAGLAKASRS